MDFIEWLLQDGLELVAEMPIRALDRADDQTQVDDCHRDRKAQRVPLSRITPLFPRLERQTSQFDSATFIRIDNESACPAIEGTGSRWMISASRIALSADGRAVQSGIFGICWGWLKVNSEYWTFPHFRVGYPAEIQWVSIPWTPTMLRQGEMW